MPKILQFVTQSINLRAFLNRETKERDWKRLDLAARGAVRQLDNLCDITNTPVVETSIVQSTRALGLGDGLYRCSRENGL